MGARLVKETARSQRAEGRKEGPAGSGRIFGYSAATCATVGASPATVVRRMSRGWDSS
jgi:hypothetical protein